MQNPHGPSCTFFHIILFCGTYFIQTAIHWIGLIGPAFQARPKNLYIAGISKWKNQYPPAMKKTLILLTIVIFAYGCKNETGWKLAPGIFILDKDSPVETYKDLAARLPRNAIYLDRWATWCTPCVEEFAFYTELRPFLEENSIEILFLNSDMDIEESQWFAFIREHRLQGYHIRLNKSLQRDLIDKGLFIPMIPQFMIIDSTGKVLEHSAMRPSHGEALRDQLIESLGL